jgi:hypothetical protein
LSTGYAIQNTDKTCATLVGGDREAACRSFLPKRRALKFRNEVLKRAGYRCEWIDEMASASPSSTASIACPPTIATLTSQKS